MSRSASLSIGSVQFLVLICVNWFSDVDEDGKVVSWCFRIRSSSLGSGCKDSILSFDDWTNAFFCLLCVTDLLLVACIYY